MAEVINMPRLSDTMEEGTVAKWLFKVGEKISEGDILAEIETDKATMEFESFNEGTLLYIGVKEGETAPVDVLLAIIGDKDEDISELIKGNTNPTNTTEKEEEIIVEAEVVVENTSVDIPDGVEVITMPRLSDTMEEGTVATWNKKVGDEVSEGDILAEIETDKATMEFESFYTGVLLEIGVKEGETALVDSVLAIVGPKGTDVSGLLEKYTSGSNNDSPAKKTTVKKESSVVVETKIDAPKAVISTSASDNSRIFISPLAKKLAEEKGINLSQVRGSGENGRIIKRDIENYQPVSVANTTAYTPVGEESFEEVKNSQMRKVIAKRLGESKFMAPHYYLTIELDMDHAISARTAINSDPDVRVSFNDMVVKASAMALRKHPKVNSHWTDTSTLLAKHIHIGVAVAVDEGLLVPVLKFADQMTFHQIGANVKELAGKARNKKLTPQEMEGSTFTVSNLGMFGIKEFTSIINQPNSAILSVGAIVQKPVVKNGQIAVGNTMTVTLACDHRTVDGATGAAFLQTFRKYVENPVTMFV